MPRLACRRKERDPSEPSRPQFVQRFRRNAGWLLSAPLSSLEGSEASVCSGCRHRPRRLWQRQLLAHPRRMARSSDARGAGEPYKAPSEGLQPARLTQLTPMQAGLYTSQLCRTTELLRTMKTVGCPLCIAEEPKGLLGELHRSGDHTG